MTEPLKSSGNNDDKLMMQIFAALTVMIVLVAIGIIISFDFAPTSIEVFWAVTGFFGLTTMNFFVFQGLKRMGTSDVGEIEIDQSNEKRSS